MKIKSVILSDKGCARGHNEDNFYYDNTILEDLDESIFLKKEDTSMCQLYAVYDGMGGESSGEVASRIASSTLKDLSSVTENNVVDALYKANRDICQYMFDNKIKRMGSTAALIYTEKETLTAINIGDSRIYSLKNKVLKQLSKDHITKNGEISQHLGIFESELKIEPYIYKGIINGGDRYLICSDGLYNMLDDNEIEKIMNSSSQIEVIAKKLMECALQNGGKDNITLIILEATKEPIKKYYIAIGLITLILVLYMYFLYDTKNTVPITGIALDIDYLEMDINDTYKFEYEIDPANGDKKTLKWEVSDDSIIEIKNNKIKALKSGYAKVVVSAPDVYYECEIYVK